MCSTCFGHYYIHHKALATVLLNYYIGRIVLGSMCVGVVVIQQNNLKFLIMDILMSEIC